MLPPAPSKRDVLLKRLVLRTRLILIWDFSFSRENSGRLSLAADKALQEASEEYPLEMLAFPVEKADVIHAVRSSEKAALRGLEGLQHTISGRFSSRAPNMQQMPIRWKADPPTRHRAKHVLYAQQYGHRPKPVGALHVGAAAHRAIAARSVEPAPGNSGDLGRGRERPGSGQALRQRDRGGRGQPNWNHRKTWPDRDDSGRRLRLVGDEQGFVPNGGSSSDVGRSRGHSVRAQRGKRKR